jgi:hypothetical protein
MHTLSQRTVISQSNQCDATHRKMLERGRGSTVRNCVVNLAVTLSVEAIWGFGTPAANGSTVAPAATGER